jgi:CrcB protein
MSHRNLAFLLIFGGGGLGSMLRHAVNLASAALFGVSFPYGTIIVNITGSFAVGVVAGWFALRGHGGQMTSLFLTTGILGGFTTFSAFSLDAALLWERGQATGAILYAVGSVTVAIIGVFVGLAAMRTLLM